MNVIEHLVIKSGKFYYTYLGGYSLNIDTAMFVTSDAKLVGRQRFVKIQCITIYKEINRKMTQ